MGSDSVSGVGPWKSSLRPHLGNLAGSSPGSREAQRGCTDSKVVSYTAVSIRVTQRPSLSPRSPFQHRLQRTHLPPPTSGSPRPLVLRAPTRGPLPPCSALGSSPVCLLSMHTGLAGPWLFPPESESASCHTVLLEGPSEAPGL